MQLLFFFGFLFFLDLVKRTPLHYSSSSDVVPDVAVDVVVDVAVDVAADVAADVAVSFEFRYGIRLTSPALYGL